MADTTNTVESLHSVRRKWADKRINFQASYKCRANLAVLSGFLDNWQQLVLEKIGIPVTDYMLEFFKVLVLYINNNQTVDERKKKNMIRKSTTKYIISRYKAKAKKYQQKESKEFTYGVKKEKIKRDGKIVIKKQDGKSGVKKEREIKPRSCVCYGCGKIVTEYNFCLHSNNSALGSLLINNFVSL
jgi:hypothetical protein